LMCALVCHQPVFFSPCIPPTSELCLHLMHTYGGNMLNSEFEGAIPVI
jgi:hypothetical protein